MEKDTGGWVEDEVLGEYMLKRSHRNDLRG